MSKDNELSQLKSDIFLIGVPGKWAVMYMC